MRKVIVWGMALVVLAVVNLRIADKEEILSQGTTMLLRLAPADSRSPVHGQYMILRYAMAQEVPEDQLENEGCLVVSLDEHNVAKFVRIHRAEELQPGEHLLFFRNRGGLQLGAESFFIQEGGADLYSKARFAELRTDASGTSVLKGLRGEDRKPLGRTGTAEEEF